MKSIFIKTTLFSIIATVLFGGVYYLTQMNIFTVLFYVGIIVTVFSFLAFLFCLIFKKELKNEKDKFKEYEKNATEKNNEG